MMVTHVRLMVAILLPDALPHPSFAMMEILARPMAAILLPGAPPHPSSPPPLPAPPM